MDATDPGAEKALYNREASNVSMDADVATLPMKSIYSDVGLIALLMKENRHRDVVGGLWEEVGKLQFDFLCYIVANGPRHDAYLLDIGCGCFRGGIYFAEYLDVGHYFGVDMHRSRLDAGYDIELAARGLQHNRFLVKTFCARTNSISPNSRVCLTLPSRNPFSLTFLLMIFASAYSGWFQPCVRAASSSRPSSGSLTTILRACLSIIL
jgi:hypothetical protein